MQAQRAVRRCKCVVLGAPGVGKSALVQAFHSDGTQFPKTYTMVRAVTSAEGRGDVVEKDTVHAEVCVKTVNIPDSPASVELFLFDVAGHDAFAEYVPKYCDGAAVFMLVFDVANADSFAALAKLLPVARHARVGKSNAGILVANKVDLTTRRVVTTAQAEEFAKANRLAYFECSAV
ncbi:Intraflagellar transport protein 27 [Cladochytrium tenue]|nr:Intraflagellar transport protein 27 [Cladochytrium tenue]